MSPDPAAQAGGPETGAGAGAEAASEEDRARAAYEAELSRISSGDMILQAAVSLLNIGARRLGGREEETGAGGSRGGREGEAAGGAATRDLEQVRDAIDAVRALLEVLERRVPEGLGPLRDALAQLQLAYAREVQAGPAEPQHGERPPESAAAAPPGGEGGGAAGDQAEPSAGEGAPAGEDQPRRPGPAESSGRLWVPGR